MSDLTTPVLRRAEDKIEAGLEPETKANYDKIVISGMHAALANGSNGLMGELAKSQDPITDAAKGAVSLVLILRKQAKGVMPLKAMVPAATSLMLKALDFVARSKIAKVGTPELVRATHVMTDFLFKNLGITKEGIARAAEKVHGLTQDPEAMAKINEKSGLIPHPGAATPTPMPGANGAP